MKSLKLDHPVKQGNDSHTSGIMQGKLIGAHPTAPGFALVDFGDGNPVNVRMTDSSVGWAGATVNVQTMPDGKPIVGFLAENTSPAASGESIAFGPTATRILENEQQAKSIESKANSLAESLAGAKDTLDQAQERLDAVAAETPKALQVANKYRDEFNKQLAAQAKQVESLVETSHRAVEQANSAVQSAAQLAGLIESRGKTLISRTQPSGADSREGNIWIKLVSPGVSNTYIYESGQGWVEVDDDGIRQAAQHAIDAQAQAERAEQAARQAKTEAAQAQSSADRAYTHAESANVKSGEAADKAEQAKNTAQVAEGKAKQAQVKANSAQSTAETAKSKAEAAKSTAETAKSKAEAAKSTAETASQQAGSAMLEAKKAPRKVLIRSLITDLKNALSEPYREGDTIMVGDDAEHITSVMVYSGGAWKRELLTVDNLVVNNAMWTKLVEADEGNVKDLIVQNQATVNDLVVAGKTKMRELIAEIIRGKRIEGVEVIGGSYASTSGNVKVNDNQISVYRRGRYTGYVALVPGRTENWANPGIEFKTGSTADNPLAGTPTYRISVNSMNDAGDVLDISDKNGEIAAFGDLWNMMEGAQGPDVKGIRSNYVGKEYGRRHTVTPRYSISGDHVNLRMNSVNVNEWETEVLYKLPYISNVTGGMSRYIRLENLPRTSKTYMWELILVDAVGISLDWAGTSDGVYQFKIKNTGSYTHDVAKAYIRRTLVES